MAMPLLKTLAVICSAWILALSPHLVLAQGEVYESLGAEQAKEKMQLEKMKDELDDINKTVTEGMQQLQQLNTQLNRQKAREFHLIAREAGWEFFPPLKASTLTYNGQLPGPQIRVRQGDLVRVVLHNQLTVPTSLYFHGLLLPHEVNGLPRLNAGLVGPGQTYAYQFVASQPGSYWYHPHVIHADQQARGLYGFLVVDPEEGNQGFQRDFLVMLGQSLLMPQKPHATTKAQAGTLTTDLKRSEGQISYKVISPADASADAVSYFTVNGKCAPAIPPMELRKGERVRLRVVNTGQETCPLHLTGHRFEILSVNGGDPPGGAPLLRDTIALQPGDRLDLAFTADNPGVWSLCSELVRQSSNNGTFPGGIAVVVRYSDHVAIEGRPPGK